MALSSLHEHEIVLNSVKFPIDGFVRESLISRFPAKSIIGEYDYANEQILSNFITSDQKGGMLIEEMDESIHANRYWWSTCDTRFRSNIMLPPLATQLSDPSTPSAGNETPDNVTDPSSGWSGIAATIDGNTGSAATDSISADNWSGYLQFTMDTGSRYSSGLRYHASESTPGVFDINVDAFYNNQWNTVVAQGDLTPDSWTTVSLSGNQWVKEYRVRFYNHGGVPNTISFNEVEVVVVASTLGNGTSFADFDGDHYHSRGNYLMKVANSDGAYSIVFAFPETISALVESSDNNLLIYLGDDDNYWYMDTSDVFTETDVALANLGLRWDGKTWKMAADGRWWSIVSPGVASPSWVTADASGGLDDYNLTPKSLDVYFDANGNQIPYCATTKGLYAFSSSDAKWIETALALPEHDQTGLGLIVWHDALFISGGLSVSKYTSGATAVITSVGLDEDNGMPQLRSGEIVKFIKGYNEYFALIDSTYEGSGSRSQVVSYDGRGWRTWWEATADNKNMYSGIVSSVFAHRFWFSTTDGVYYIPLSRTGLNPKKVSGSTFASAGIHITPRFDAGTKAFPKLATKLTLFLDDMGNNETVTVTYQIDQTQGDLTSSWTALVSAQTSDGVKEQTFGTNGVGVVFYDIQFRYALVRGTDTLSPIIKGAVLSYLKLLGRKKAWSMTINIAEAGQVGATPKELYDAIATILASNTLLPFTYRDDSAASDTYYVYLQPIYGFFPTGPNWDGKYDLTLIEI